MKQMSQPSSGQRQKRNQQMNRYHRYSPARNKHSFSFKLDNFMLQRESKLKSNFFELKNLKRVRF